MLCDAYFQSMLGENTVVKEMNYQTKKTETKDALPLDPKIAYS